MVVDVECTCFQTPVDAAHPLYRGDSEPRDGEESEIIEIGLCELDLRTFERSAKTSILIKPERSRVTPFCTRLTTLTQAQLDAEGGSYEDACARLVTEFKSHQKPWCSWGEYDRTMFETSARRRMPIGPVTPGYPRAIYPWSRTHTNAKHMMSLAMGRFDGEFGMDHACAVAGFELEGTHHRGHDDAWNIAAVVAWLLRKTRASFGPSLLDAPRPGAR